MARRWTTEEEVAYRNELQELYIVQNKTIREVGVALDLAEQTVFKRLLRLGIQTQREKKPHCNKQRTDVFLPKRSPELAELVGLLLGDGHISHFQTIVTLDGKEKLYAEYVADLMQKLFSVRPKVLLRKEGYYDIYIGSVKITKWLCDQGMVHNKVAEQVDVPQWIFKKKSYMRMCLRGFFDTDGSIYNLRYGIQISFSNRSFPLLLTLQEMLKTLGYKPSEISGFQFYLTRKGDILRFFDEIAPKNNKHLQRFHTFMRRSDSGNSRRL